MIADMKRMIRWLLGMLVIGVVAAASAPANTATPGAHVVLCSAPATEAPAPSDRSLTTAVKNSAEKMELKPGGIIKDAFKDFRPGTCKTTSHNAPMSSWPARGEAAISFCRP